MNFGIDGGLEGGVAKVVGQVTTGRLTETLVLMPGGAVDFGTVVSCPGAFADDCPEGLLDWPELAR
jgi:hypothetical protein